MISPAPVSGFAVRLVGVGAVVFLANAGLLVLQLVAGKLLAPFLGSSLSTWTCVIAAFLTGIAFGNAIGGRLADKSHGAGQLVRFLVAGALASLWMIALPELLLRTELHRSLELTVRIPILAFALCFPAGFTLSLLTPLAIRIGVPDVARSGSVAGSVFALSTLGCLLGNYLTGFKLIPNLELNWIVTAVAIALIVVAALVYTVIGKEQSKETPSGVPVPGGTGAISLAIACTIVFLCSFAGMSLELGAVRLLAPELGVSLFTWTGVIGVMLAGTALGNFSGGRIADWATRSPDPKRPAATLGTSLLFCGLTTVLVVLLFVVLTRVPVFAREFKPGDDSAGAFTAFGYIERVLIWTFSLFFLPMFGLGLISPQVIRLAVTSVGAIGRTAGTVYAWSIAGAIAGTFATGFVLISNIGVNKTVLLAALLPCLALLFLRVPKIDFKTGLPTAVARSLILDSNLILYGLAATLGAVFGGFVLNVQQSRVGTSKTEIPLIYELLETNYYTIVVKNGAPALEFIPPSEALAAVVGPQLDPQRRFYRELILDSLRHSQVNMQDPTYLHYRHEYFQIEVLRMFAEERPSKQNVLVIGGGGYTFPRCARTLLPTANVDVVEIDPGVTHMAKLHLGLTDEYKINSFHLDGRQFVTEQAKPGTYDLVTLDAVNDFSVPSHLMTKEFNASVKKSLAADGVYLVTVIDHVDSGQLWKAAAHTLRETFGHVEMVFPKDYFDDDQPYLAARSVIVLYASDKPLDPEKLKAAVRNQADAEPVSQIVRRSAFELMLNRGKKIVLTDQFCPTDNLMIDVYKKR